MAAKIVDFASFRLWPKLEKKKKKKKKKGKKKYFPKGSFNEILLKVGEHE